jgi:DNA-binding IclR family transcriptional regulator
MLAFMDLPRQAEFLSGLPANAARTRLEESLKAARRNGYATSRGEIFVGAVAVSAPYFDHRGSVVGSVGLYGPEARVSDDKIAEYSKLVREAGRKISVLLGFQETGPAAKPGDSRSDRPQKATRPSPGARR